MRTALIAYCLGIYLVSLLPELSQALALSAGSLWLCLLLLVACARRKILLVACLAFGLGMSWHWSWGLRGLQQILPPQFEGQDLLVEGRVVGLPIVHERGQRFELQLLAGGPLAAKSKLQLNYYAPPDESAPSEIFRPGDHWRLRVRLKQPHGFANPGSYNREAFLFRKRIIATGSVRGEVDRLTGEAQGNQLVAQSESSIALLRFSLLKNLQAQIGDASYPDLLIALILGERSQLDPARWKLFSATGTNHLFVISGLHIGLLSLLGFRCCSYGLRLLPAAQNLWPAQKTAAVNAMAVAVCYSLLAGWGLPTRRACVMVIIMLSGYLTSRQPDLGLRFLLALAFVLSLDPLASTSMGFWLSFSAVGVLLFFVQRDVNSIGGTSTSRSLVLVCWSYLRAQWTVFVGLFLPLVLLLGQVSLLAPLANVIAIPVLAFLLLPLLMVACVLLAIHSGWSEYLLLLADDVLQLLLNFLLCLTEAFNQLAQMSVSLPSALELLLIVPGLTLLLLPAGFPYRILALPLLATLTMSRATQTANDLQVHVLDVGQGLSVLVQTGNHAMLFDTGPGMAGDWNAGAAIVVPALRHLGVSKLDVIMVSHGDADHAGGLAAVSAAFPGAEIIASDPVHDAQVSCVNHPGWEWGTVSFTMLHPKTRLPASQKLSSSNNNSCVLHVRSESFSLLLPGDIEEAVERELAMTLGEALNSTVLVAPHHGSNTSSSYPLLKMVMAEQVVIASGYGNSFGHPAAKVVLRHLSLGARLHNTATAGMISLTSAGAGNQPEFRHYRRDHRNYWSWSGNPVYCRYC